jgi:glycosyltransferase involved in cell wall biosynthesis
MDADTAPATTAPALARHGKPRICFVVAPSGQAGGGMGRVKDYILQSGGDRLGRLRFEALDTRGSGSAAASLGLAARAVLRIWGAALRGEVALVHVNLGDRGSAARKGLVVVLARLAGVKVALHLHAAHLTSDYAKAHPVLRWLVRKPFQAASVCIVIGRLWHDWLIDELGINPAKVAIVYNGVPVTRLPRADAADRADGTRRILFLGNLIERKGISDLLHAVAALPADPPWRLITAGGGDLDRYRALAASLGIAERVEFAGWVDQARARALLAESDMLALPSYDEGLPLVILEALGMGTPVVCTPVGAIPEVLENERTAMFATPGDRPDLTRALRRLIEDDALRASLSRDGTALYQERFTQTAFITSLFEVYRRHCGIAIEPVAPPAGG